MFDRFRGRRWAWSAVALAAVLMLGGVTYGFGVTKSTQLPLWTEQSSTAGAAPTVLAPDWVKIGRDLKPAVVNVSTKRVQGPAPEMGTPFGEDSPFDRYFRDHFGTRPQRQVRSMGSGFIINANGYIVTNNHVVDGATQLQVKLSDGREFQGKVVGRDPKTDLALLKIEATGLPVIPLGDSSALQVGEPVMAIGNPFGLEQTVTTGIVSATGRSIGAGPYDDFIQTDASVNPGNSGGPLINARGQVIGINTAIFSQSGGSVGIGFAIPVSLAKSVVTQLADSGTVTRGWLGVAIQPLTPDLAKTFNRPDTKGALVSSVTPSSPASRAGLKPGDIITMYDGRSINRVGDLPRAVAETRVGREVPVSVLRDGQTVQLTARIEALEAKEGRQAAAESEAKPSLGLSIQPLTPDLAKTFNRPDTKGALVSSVTPSSPASRAGLKPGDIITMYDGRSINRVGDLPRAVAETRVGREVPVSVLRDGQTVQLTARIEALEAKEGRQAAAESEAKPSLGLSVQPLTPDLARRLGTPARLGLVVQGVEAGSPAADAGFERGDVIVEVNRQPARSVEQLKEAVAKRDKGKPILFRIEREGASLFLTVAA
ncbi:MAG: peptidase [Candidatus Rokuibacteriota bacterium]|nr:MAG: peptidase [Candidatus Rokubacteria bacterium]